MTSLITAHSETHPNLQRALRARLFNYHSVKDLLRSLKWNPGMLLPVSGNPHPPVGTALPLPFNQTAPALGRSTQLPGTHT